MYGEYFVLVTDYDFGVFKMDAKGYPEVFLRNLDKVKCIEGSLIDAYLLKNVGRNSLSRNKYKWIVQLGEVRKR